MDINLGLIAIACSICVAFGCLSAIGEGIICAHALDESTAIYCLIMAILILFVLGGRA